MTAFVSPIPPPCESRPCELEPGHTGVHRNNMLVWHEPPLLLVGGAPPDVDRNTEHWQHGDVLFSWEEPEL